MDMAGLSIEKLWKRWGKKEEYAYYWENENNLKRYMKKFPLCERYVDAICDNFIVCYNINLKHMIYERKINGTCSSSKKIIEIRPISNEEDTKTLIHEIIHLVYSIPGGGIYEEEIEEEVERIIKKKEILLYIVKKFGNKFGIPPLFKQQKLW